MRHSVFPFISRLIILIYWSMDIIAVLKFKVFENSNIFVVSGLVCADCLFLWHTLKFPDSLYIYWIILDCILYTLNFVMWIWILFKSSGEYRLCFSSYFNMHLTQLSSGCKSLPTFCKLLVQSVYFSKSFNGNCVYLFAILWLVLDLGSILSHSYVLKTLLCSLGSVPPWYSSRLSPRIHL